MKTFKCPKCGEKIEELIYWQVVSHKSYYDLSRQEYGTTVDSFSDDGGEYECPECREILTEEELKKLDCKFAW